MTIDQSFEMLVRGCADVVSREELKKKLLSGKKLRIKLGVDPTSADLHFGHSVVLNKMRAFEELGHTGVLVIGDFTAAIGDPSGRDSTRPVLNDAKIKENAKTYMDQAFKILDPQKTEIRFNGEWLKPFVTGGSDGVLAYLSKVTVSRLLEREDFKNRMKAGTPISMLEILYPLFQGYDSVALKADVELGGADQIFNLLMGRDMQKDFAQDPQIVMTVPLLVGTDGVKKMSKSYGNYVGLCDTPQDMFGKVMSVSDELMFKYYELLTLEDMSAIKAMHPMQAKKKLASIMVERFHSAEAAADALAGFEKVFSKKELPQDMKTVSYTGGSPVSAVIVQAGFAASRGEARRLLEQGGVRLDGEKIVQDSALDSEGVLQVGRRNFCRLAKK